LCFEISSPALWDLDSPVLYTAKTTVSVDGAVTDEKDDTFGFRTIEFTADRGFFLN
jgi:beta-galactosidase